MTPALPCAPAASPAQAMIGQFRADVLRGLRAAVKEVPCKYLYDEAGSRLFERITELDEYYLTRTELAIMRAHAAAMAGLMNPGCLLIEYGSGSSAKTRLLIDHLRDPAGYVPIDISESFLRSSAEKIARAYPALAVLPLCADFAAPLELPIPRLLTGRRVVYFPGSTIGNFGPAASIRLLKRTAQLCGPGGGMLLGADLRKDARVLEAAYNDARGITAAFNRNLLVRINRELGADFEPALFEHRAFYDSTRGRVEMRLVSMGPQAVHLGEEEISFSPGEFIRTEYCYKYDLEGLRRLAGHAGFRLEQTWVDERKYFSVNYFTVSDD